MANGPSLRVKVSADLADIKQGLALLRTELGTVKRQAERAAPSTNAWQKGLQAVRRQLMGIASIYTAIRAGGAYLRLADEAANLSGRLRLATRSQQEFNRAHSETFRIAQRTSAEWGSIIGLYSQLAQTTGMAQERILQLTEAVGLSFAVSGSSAQDTARGIVQLQQAMAGGILRAEEFRTLLQTNSRLVQALADHFGIAYGRVQQYVNDGKITTRDMAEAIIKASGDMRAEFERLPLTVGKAMQQVRNALLRLVGDTDQAEGATRDLADALADFARFLESDDAKRGLAALINGIATAARLFGQLAGKISEAHSKYREWLNTQGFAASADLDNVEHLEERIRKLSRMMYGNDPLNTLRRQLFGPSIRKELQDAIAARARLLGGDPETATGTGGGGGSPDEPTEPGKAIARSNALLRDSVSRAIAELDRLYKANEIGFKEYFATWQQLQEQAIDLQIEQARNELAVTKDAGKRRDLEEQIAILMRDRADVAVRAAREQKEAEEELTKALGAVKLRLLELDGETGRVERAKLEEEYRDLFKRLEAASDEAGQAMVRNLIERLVAKAQFDQLGDRLSQVTGRLASTEGSVSAQMQAGALGMGEGERRLNAAREAALAKLRQLRAETVAYLKTLAPDSKEAADALDFLDRIDTELANVAASQRRLAMAIEDQAVSAFGDFLGDLVEGTKSFKEAFTDMVRNFVAGVARMMAQELALRAIRSLIGGWGGGASAGVGHSGGVAGMLGTVRRNVSPLMFGAAPRYHNGGVAGLAPDEVPAILRRGEEVLTQSDPRHRFNGGMGGGGDRTVVKTPIVAIGDRAVADALASAAGEEVVLTHVRNNWDTLVNGPR